MGYNYDYKWLSNYNYGYNYGIINGLLTITGSSMIINGL